VVLRQHPHSGKPAVAKSKGALATAKFDRFDFMSNEDLKAVCRQLEGVSEDTWLYEITTPLLRKDVVRVYAWTNDLPWAMKEAVRAFREGGVGELEEKELQARRLFQKGQAQFVTIPAGGFGAFLFDEDDK
jgi:hypothetical protein